VVAPGTDALELGHALRGRLATDAATVTVGVAIAPGGAADIPSGHVEARRCTDTLLALERAGDVSDPAHLGLARLLLGTSGPGELDDFVTAVLGPVADYDRERGSALVETLGAWFDAGGSLRDTAAVLHVHPNTVGQRLDRISSLLGDDWRLPVHALDLQLALRLHRLRAARPDRANRPS
jgi:DNA-binding PucR family transcriptional regulator